MVESRYARAYTEILEIISHFSEEGYNRIPKEQIEFFKENMDKEYKYKIDPKKELEEQEISKETNAIIIKLFKDYFATESQKEKIDKILWENQIKEEEEKEPFDYKDIFKNSSKEEFKVEDDNVNKSENTEQNSLIKYEESFFEKVKKFILNLFFKKFN